LEQADVGLALHATHEHGGRFEVVEDPRKDWMQVAGDDGGRGVPRAFRAELPASTAFRVAVLTLGTLAKDRFESEDLLPACPDRGAMSAGGGSFAGWTPSHHQVFNPLCGIPPPGDTMLKLAL